MADKSPNLEKYRKADVIELHDAGRVIADHRYSMEGWFGYFGEASDGYLIEGESIAEFCKIFGIHVNSVPYRSPKTGKTYQRHLQEFTFKIRKFRTELKECKVVKLLAKIKGPNLISIIFCAHYDEDSIDDIYQIMEYSGSFTVWWEEDMWIKNENRN